MLQRSVGAVPGNMEHLSMSEIESLVNYIRKLTPEEKKQLDKQLAEEHLLPTYLRVARLLALGEHLENICHPLMEELRRLGRFGLETSNELHRRGKGPRTKKERLTKRNAEIDDGIAKGITEPEAIFKHLQEHHPDLVRKGKKGWISPKMMMLIHERSKRRK
jgi:hypothetical protein